MKMVPLRAELETHGFNHFDIRGLLISRTIYKDTISSNKKDDENENRNLF